MGHILRNAQLTMQCKTCQGNILRRLQAGEVSWSMVEAIAADHV